jgi:hypothetical protein
MDVAYQLTITDEQRETGLKWVKQCKQRIAEAKRNDTKRINREQWLNRLAIKANQLPNRVMTRAINEEETSEDLQEKDQ